MRSATEMEIGGARGAKPAGGGCEREDAPKGMAEKEVLLP